MCGLCGVVGDVYKNEKELFGQLLFLNTFRGMHGCGMFGLWYQDKKRYRDVIKSEMPASEFVLTEKYEKFTEPFGTKALLGHARHATQGSKEVKNNHPFAAGHIIGMHNGTILHKFSGRDKYETDSEALFHLIAEAGDKEALKEVHGGYTTPAYALAWYDVKDSSLNFIRNQERPFWYGVDKDKRLWYASEYGMLVWLFSRNGVKDVDLKTLTPGDKLTIYPFSDGKDRAPILQKNYFKAPEKTTTNTTYWNRGGCNNQTNSNVTYKKKGPKGFHNFVKMGNLSVTKFLYNKMLEDGCSYCGIKHEMKDDKLDVKVCDGDWNKDLVAFYTDKVEYICPDCIKYIPKELENTVITPEWDNT